ncbi:MAG: EAL domain-containing protein [Acidimicrobiia bacterium]|nr:EAL domain-containing protein [Acidimicrobiia bacterium]
MVDTNDARARATAPEALGGHRFELVALVDVTGMPMYVSRSSQPLLGRDSTDLFGALHPELVHPEDWAGIVGAWSRARATPGASVEVACRMLHADGSWRWFEATLTNLIDVPGFDGILVNARDVTDRVVAEQALRTSESRFRALLQNSFDLVVAYTLDGYLTYVSPSVRRVLGFEPEAGLGRSIFDFIHADDHEEAHALAQRLRGAPGTLDSGEFRVVDAGGSWRVLEAICSDLSEVPGIEGFVLNARDVTDRVEAEHALRASEERFRALVQHSADAIWVIDEGGRYSYCSPALREMLGVDPSEVVGREVSVRTVHPEDRDRTRDVLDRCRHEPVGSTLTSEHRLRHRDGTWRWVEARITNMLGVPGVEGLVVNVRDVTDRKRAEDQLRHRALHDDLTGLPNRVLLVDRLSVALERARRSGTRVGVLFLDLDHFKLVNDGLGHDAGDRLLVAVARRVAGTLRAGDTLARFGGDELVIVCEGGDPATVADRVLRALRAPFRLDETTEVPISASVGIVVDDGTAGPHDLLRDADVAMYEAKRSGRGRAATFESRLGTTARRRLGTASALSRALDRGELRVHYQPAIRIADGEVVGVEALVRWEVPGYGLADPDDFIGIAEETGLVAAIGEWVAAESARQLARWDRAVPGAAGLIAWHNVSAVQLDHPDRLVAGVRDAAAAAGLTPDRLGVEITESSLVRDPEQAVAALQALREVGVHVAIDDFGVGYSSLAHLRRLPVDVLKIDRSFVADLGRDADAAALVSSIVGLAHNLGLAAVAEGVETAEQLALLRRAGCEQAQGYYLLPPTEADELTRVLATGPRCA